MLIGSIVLAGGRSRRMGQPKEALPFRSSTLLGETVETLIHCTHPVVVVARDADQDLPPLALESELVYDAEPGQGPLVGIAAGLRAVTGECDAAFVCSCDMPFLDASVISWMAGLLGDRDVVMPKADGVLQPLVALYRTGVLAEIDKMIAEGIRTPRTLAERVPTRVLGDDDIDAFDRERRFLHNINNPDDYDAAVRAAGDA